jgi:hypothetical protein
MSNLVNDELIRASVSSFVLVHQVEITRQFTFSLKLDMSQVIGQTTGSGVHTTPRLSVHPPAMVATAAGIVD